MFCKKCGQKLNPGDKYCPKCGSPVIKEVITEKEVIQEEPKKELPKVKPSGGFLKRFFLGLWNIVRRLFKGLLGVVRTVIFIALFLALVYFMFRGISYMAENYPIAENIEKFFESLFPEPTPQPQPSPQPSTAPQPKCKPCYCPQYSTCYQCGGTYCKNNLCSPGAWCCPPGTYCYECGCR